MSELLQEVGGQDELFKQLRNNTEAGIIDLAKCLGIKVNSQGNVRPGALCSSIVQAVLDIDKTVSKRANSHPCHWCAELTDVLCTKCGKYYVHHMCMIEHVPVITDLGARLCRVCAKPEMDFILKKSTDAALAKLCEELEVQPGNTRKETLELLRSRCSFSKVSDLST